MYCENTPLNAEPVIKYVEITDNIGPSSRSWVCVWYEDLKKICFALDNFRIFLDECTVLTDETMQSVVIDFHKVHRK